MEFTAIGETVNVASRLVEIGKKYPRSILLSEEVAKKVGRGYQLQPIGAHSVRGIDKEIELSILVGRTR